MWAPKRGGYRNIRKASIAALSAFCAAILSQGCVVAQDISPSATPTQLAAAIARTMSATSPTLPANSPVTQQFGSHDNVVESRTVFKDPNAFANAAAHRRDIEVGTTRYMCKAERLAYIRRGVVFHNVTAGPDAKSSFAFIIDEQACASLTKPAVADAATLTTMAQDIARQLTISLPAELPTSGSRFEKAVTRDGVIQIINIITAPAFAHYFQMKSFEIRGKTQGWFCSKFGDAIRQGVRMHVVYKIEEDGAPVLEFPIDTSVC